MKEPSIKAGVFKISFVFAFEQRRRRSKQKKKKNRRISEKMRLQRSVGYF